LNESRSILLCYECEYDLLHSNDTKAAFHKQEEAIMGQSESQPTTAWRKHANGGSTNNDNTNNKHKPKTTADLWELDNDELQQLLLTSESSSPPLTAQYIQMVARSLTKTEQQRPQDDDDDPLSKTNSGFYSRAADSPEAKLALRLHGLSKELAQFRF
jgi:hypothetical protein